MKNNEIVRVRTADGTVAAQFTVTSEEVTKMILSDERKQYFDVVTGKENGVFVNDMYPIK